MAKLTETCKDCGESFQISDSEQSFYKEKGFFLPKRCSDCRRKKKEKQLSEGR